jgi:hypothetical protein
MTRSRTILAGLIWLASVGVAFAQSLPSWPITTYEYVATPAQWGQAFSQKQDYLGGMPCIVTGCSMSGILGTTPSTTFGAGFNIQPGTVPTSPNNGDVWTTSVGMFVQINGVTIGPLTEGTAGSFTGTSPLVVSFPGGGVVNYAFNFSIANTFLAQQTDQGATTTSPGWYAQVAGDAFPRVLVGLNATDVASLELGPGSAARDTFLERAGPAAFRLGSPDAAAPIAQLMGVQNVVAGTSNTAGTALTIAGSSGTGTAAGGDVLLQVAPAGTTGSTQNALVTSVHLYGLDGGATVGAPTGGDKGAFTLNSQGLIYVAGKAVAISASGPLVLNASTGALTCPTCVTGTSGALTSGTTATSGYTTGQILGSTGSVLSAYSVNGTGNVVLTTSASLITPALGVATATSEAVGGCTIGSNAFCVTGTSAMAATTITGSFTATGLVTLADLATQSANTFLANITSGVASPTAATLPPCTGSAAALQYTSGTGLSCGTITAAASSISYGVTTAGTSVGIPYNATNGGTLSALAITSGGILYGSSSTVPAFSGALTQFGPVFGGGAGGAPTAGTAGAAGQILIGQTGANAAFETAGGDVASISNTGRFTLAATNTNLTTLANLTTVGTIGTGVWQGSVIAAAYHPNATNAALGIMRGDGTTISCTTGVCTALGASATSIDASGATSISNGTSNAILYDNAGNIGKIAVVNSSVFCTSSGGVPSGCTTLPVSITYPTPTFTGTVTATGEAFNIGANSQATSLTINGGSTGATAGLFLAVNGATSLALASENNISGSGSTTKLSLYSSSSNFRFFGLGAGTMTTDASGNVVITSDETLKNIHGKFTRGLADLVGINPILYSWNEASGNETEGTYAGFSAQNVQRSIPEAVGHTAEGKLTLQDRPVIAALVNAVKQLSQEVDRLKTKAKRRHSNRR